LAPLSTLSREDEASITDLMMRAFSGQVRRIPEWSIQHLREAGAAFRHT
jgi:hypothetical protein